ncbi:type II secretion system GspH family protein [Acidiferrimicrobium sp. IK]|uniref:type IV pilin protein n=1 Tax=Acidiferrimicrobium sp. IK TaxID=2871700 RepID=UPI0029164DCC|nr:type II secretion system protein [Acidiferrimicrobium sp. IK]MCU4184831.1 type II secretion system GspH family protein [Acidiferrimicrobium sp. IK]
MFKSITDKAEREEGFTLIELMVVVLIIGILMAIAIPTFLGAKNSANARATQSDLRNAITAEQTYYTNNGQVYGAATDVSALEPALKWTAMASSTAASTGNGVDVDLTSSTPGSSAVVVGALGADGNAYYVYDNNGVVSYETIAKGTSPMAYTALPTTTVTATSSKGAWATAW